MILHTPDTMTIRNYARFEKSKDLRKLFRLPVPIYIAIRYAPTFIQQFNDIFNSGGEAEIDKTRLKLIAQNKILLMQVLLTAIQFHLGEKIQLEMLKGGAIKQDEKLLYYISEVEKVCGITIETLEDIISYRNELERKIDKYNQLFPVQVQKSEGVSIMQLAFSVFSIMNMPFDGEMKLAEFAELKHMADERTKQMQQQIDKNNM